MRSLRFPLVAAFLAFLTGLLASLRFGAPALPLLLPGTAALLLGLVVSWRWLGTAAEAQRWALLLLAFAATGGALGVAGRRTAALDCRATLPDAALLTLEGVLASNLPPPAATTRPGIFGLHVAEVRAGGRRLPGCGGLVRVRFPEGAGALRAGSRVRLAGEWVRAASPVAASAWPREPLYAGLIAGDSLLAAAPPRFLRHPLLWLRGRTEAHLWRIFPRHAALADALLLGRRESLDPAMRQRFAQSGLVHLLAISGSHVALLAAALLVLGVALRLPRRAVSLGTMLLVAAYLAVIGAPPSAVRAGLMIALALTGALLQRPAASAAFIAAAAWLILAVEPLAALDPGFQLSFAGVLGIVAAHRLLWPRRPPRWLRRAPVRAVAELMLASFGAFLATAPITAFHFGQVAPVSLLANLPAIPLTTLALVALVLAALTEPLLPPLGRLAADGAGLLLELLDGVAAWAAALPGGHFGVARPQGWAWAVAGVVLLLAADAAVRLRPRVRWAVATAAAAAVLLAWPVLAARGEGALELYFIDVGQGDALAIRTPAGRWLLVDAGPRTEHSDAGERRVLPFLRAHGATRLEALFLTHPDADHIGGAPAVLRGIPVGRVVEPGMPAGKELYLEVLDAARERGVPWAAARSGGGVEVDGVALDVLWPGAETAAGAEDENDASVVLRLRYGGFTALLPGDAPAEVERRLVARYGAGLRAELLKAGHHGSLTSTAPEWLAAVQPEAAVVSAGRRNRYGHPAPAVLARLREHGVRVLRTDRDGTVGVRVVLADSVHWSQTEP